MKSAAVQVAYAAAEMRSWRHCAHPMLDHCLNSGAAHEIQQTAAGRSCAK